MNIWKLSWWVCWGSFEILKVFILLRFDVEDWSQLYICLFISSFFFSIFRYELAEECSDDDDAKLAISDLRKAVLEELKMHDSFLQVRIYKDFKSSSLFVWILLFLVMEDCGRKITVEKMACFSHDSVFSPLSLPAHRILIWLVGSITD